MSGRIQMHPMLSISRGGFARIAAIERASVEATTPWTHDYDRRLVSVARALRAENSYGSLEELLPVVFGDFLEMAQHLVDNGYKDAAAVVAGSTLEVHRISVHSLSTVASGENPRRLTY